MAIPEWAVEQVKRQLRDVAAQLKNPEAVQQLRDRAGEWLQELPQAAREAWQQARDGAQAGPGRPPGSALGTAVVNASGVFYGGAVSATPVAAAAVAAGTDNLASFRTARHSSRDWFEQEASRVAKRVGCERMLVASGVEAAVWALAEVAKRRRATVLVPRCCAIALAGGMSLPEWLVAAGASVREIGSNDGLDAEQWKRADAGERDVLLVAEDPARLGLVASQVQCTLVSLIRGASVEPLGGDVSPAPPTFAQLLDGATDMVITSGGGLLGGPECGLIMGRRPLLDEIAATELWSIIQADAATQTMLLVAAQRAAEKATERATPVAELLETSIDNLRHRAENLCTRLAAADESDGGVIRRCLVTDRPARLVAGAPYEVSSRQLRLQHVTLSPQSWAAQLLDQTPAILADVDDDALVLDLRWVDAAQDAALASALVGGLQIAN